MERIAYVGMDVDKEKVAVAVVEDYESKPRLQCVIGNRLDAIKDLFERLDADYSQVSSCYEAGACGFELYRRVTDLGALCVVVAPSSVPKKATVNYLAPDGFSLSPHCHLSPRGGSGTTRDGR